MELEDLAIVGQRVDPLLCHAQDNKKEAERASFVVGFPYALPFNTDTF